MRLSLPYQQFKEYVLRQMNNLFPDNQSISNEDFKRVFDISLDRTAYCFKHVKLSSYSINGEPTLNHLHSDQYAVFLWFLSNTIWNDTEDNIIPNKLFYMNKTLHGLSCMYDTEMPDVFLLLHTVGTVLGKAKYSDFFVVAHGCTVGAHHGKYPVIGKGVSMLTGSSIIGECKIGANVSLGINTVVYKSDIEDDTVVYVDPQGVLSFKRKELPWSQNVFHM